MCSKHFQRGKPGSLCSNSADLLHHNVLTSPDDQRNSGIPKRGGKCGRGLEPQRIHRTGYGGKPAAGQRHQRTSASPRPMVFGAVCPSQGKAAALIMPICNTVAMNHHLCEISSQVAADAHAVEILDGASWHNSHGLVAPSNTPCWRGRRTARSLIQWSGLRSHWLANSVFRSLADIMDACEMAWNRFATNTGLVRSLACACYRTAAQI